MSSAAGITFLQQDQHEVNGHTVSSKAKAKKKKEGAKSTQEIVNEQAKAKAAKAAAEKKAAADAGKAKAKGAKASLFKDVEFGGQLCLQVGIPLKPFCPGE